MRHVREPTSNEALIARANGANFVSFECEVVVAVFGQVLPQFSGVIPGKSFEVSRR